MSTENGRDGGLQEQKGRGKVRRTEREGGREREKERDREACRQIER